FYLKRGKLYSFWVSPTAEGYSRGFVGAGGPAFASFKDEPQGGAPQPPGAQLNSSAQNINLGQSVTLTYSTFNAQTASLNPAIAGCNVVANQSGSCSFTPSAAGSFTFPLTAQGNGQTAQSSVTITVAQPQPPPPATPAIASFTASAQQI